MKKIDFKKQLKQFYGPGKRQVVGVDVPAMNFLMIDGQGDPNSSLEYSNALAALYPVAYSLKFTVKKGDMAIDYGVMPLEGLWWADDMSVFTANDKSAWKWTMMIMQPDFISDEMVAEAIESVRAKKNPDALDLLRFETFDEGKCAQILHVGPFSEEGPTIENVHQFIDDKSGLRGKHHEIYLTDIRRADPAKWKTVIRQPMK